MHNVQITDAQGLQFLTQQTRVLSARAFNVEYDVMPYAELVPVNTDYPEWASGVDFQVGDMVGAANWQSGWAKDVPLADVKLLSVGVDFAMYAVGYRYNVEELGKAMHAGYPLTARKAISARQAADYFVAEAAFYGAGHPGWTGLINLAGVAPAPSPNTGTGSARNWFSVNGTILTGLKTPEQIIQELNSVVTGPMVATLGFRPTQLSDTVLLPSLALKYITDTPYGVTAPNKSILQYFRENNAYTAQTGRPLVIRDLPALASAGTYNSGGVDLEDQGRIIGYRNNLDSIEFPMPMPYRFLPVHQFGPLQWEIPGIGRVGQLTLIREGSVRYLDGVSPAPGGGS